MERAENDSVHSMRLHGPWQLSVFASNDSPSSSGLSSSAPAVHRVKMPSLIDPAIVASAQPDGSLVLHRGFGRPSGLDDSQTVWLVVDSVTWPATLSLNEREVSFDAVSLEPGILARIEVTQFLLPRNELTISFPVGEAIADSTLAEVLPGIAGEVRLEIV